MFRNLKIAASVISIMGIFGLFVPATYGETGAAGPAGKAKVVGNRICPVTGEKITKKTEVTYEYKGEIYSFCCRECIDEFKKDPEKYIGKIKKAAANGRERSVHPDHH
jgi:YHS domain-containing protein